ERLISAPSRCRGRRELPCVERDRRVGVDRSEVDVVKAGGREHGGPSLRRDPATMPRTAPESKAEARPQREAWLAPSGWSSARQLRGCLGSTTPAAASSAGTSPAISSPSGSTFPY